jgi:hypothetical protein
MDSEQASSDVRPRRLLWGGVIVLLALTTASMFLVDHLRRLRPGEVVDQDGTYYSPRAKYRVTVTEQPAAGFVNVEVQSKTNRLWIFSSYGRKAARYLDVERDWMLCFDEYDRLWLFIGKWPGATGKQRTHPSRGTLPDHQSVLLQGFFFDGGRLAFGENVVSATGAWAGVPPEFFARLPGGSDPGWSRGAIVPKRPVSFTKAQLNRFR